MTRFLRVYVNLTRVVQISYALLMVIIINLVYRSSRQRLSNIQHGNPLLEEGNFIDTSMIVDGPPTAAAVETKSRFSDLHIRVYVYFTGILNVMLKLSKFETPIIHIDSYFLYIILEEWNTCACTYDNDFATRLYSCRRLSTCLIVRKKYIIRYEIYYINI